MYVLACVLFFNCLYNFVVAFSAEAVLALQLQLPVCRRGLVCVVGGGR